MDINGRNIRVKENKTEGSLDSARFTLSYNQPRDENEARAFGYKLLSLLRGSSDVIMELNSDLLVLSGKSKSEIIQFYADYAKKTGLNYRYRKLPSTGSKSIFSRLLNQDKKQEAQELAVQIPAAVWETDGFRDIVNTCGTRYYFTKASGYTCDLTDEMSRMTDEDKLDFFNIVVFDLGIMGNMGINSKTLELSDLKELLNLA